MPQVTGVVEAKKADGSSICIDGQWYGSYRGTGLGPVTVGCTVDFVWTPSKDGRWKNIDAKTVRVLSPGAGIPSVPVGAAATERAPFVPKGSLGVELGHASNLAMSLMLKKYGQELIAEIGDEAFYKEWIHHIDVIYKIMSKVRKAKESEATAASPTKETKATEGLVAAEPAKVVVDSIF